MIRCWKGNREINGNYDKEIYLVQIDRMSFEIDRIGDRYICNSTYRTVGEKINHTGEDPDIEIGIGEIPKGWLEALERQAREEGEYIETKLLEYWNRLLWLQDLLTIL